MASGQKNGGLPVAPSGNRPLPALSEDTIKQLLEQQRRETDLRAQEMQLRMQELQNNSAHAEKVLATQERDIEAERSHARRMEKGRLIFAGFVLLGIASIVFAGMYLNKDALVSDMLKIMGGVVAGAIGGYGWARSHKDD